MSEILKEITGKISEDLNEAADVLSSKLGVEKPGGPNPIYTISKRESLKITFDFENDVFSVVFKEKVKEEAPKEVKEEVKDENPELPF